MIHKKEACEVKRVFKKNQIIIAALAVMIAVAGYLNYSEKIFHEKPARPLKNKVENP